MDFKIYRLNQNQELLDLIEKLGDRFAPFNDRVCRVLEAIPKEGKFNIEKEVHPSNLNLFIKCACFYIQVYNRSSHINNQWLEFTNDYKVIRRRS